MSAESSVFVEHFRELQRMEATNGHTGLASMRLAAIKRFEELGFPNPREEAWKYTDPTPIALTPFKSAAGLDPDRAIGAERLSPFTPDGTAALRLTFVDGRYSEKLSRTAKLPDGVEVSSVARLLGRGAIAGVETLGSLASFDTSPFTALNTALFADGAYVNVPDGVVLEEPVHILFLAATRGEPVAIHPRNLILLGRRSEASVIEAYAGLGDDAYLTNAVTEVVMGDGAVLRHYKLQEESNAAFHVSRTEVLQGRMTSYRSNNVNVGGRIVRNDLNTRFDGEGSECVLDGLFMGAGAQHVDNHTFIDHRAPSCTSRELYKGILDGAARGVFYGSIAVRKDAQKTNAMQTNRNLLLSKDASVDSTPQLEILADDVKCRHGSTIGQLDENALFYMRSRGIAPDRARSILTYAFASDIVARIEVPELRERVDEIVMGRFGQSEHTTEVA